MKRKSAALSVLAVARPMDTAGRPVPRSGRGRPDRHAHADGQARGAATLIENALVVANVDKCAHGLLRSVFGR